MAGKEQPGGVGERRKYRVFVSSTYLDNAERRKEVEQAILDAEMTPVGMERFASSPEPPLEQSLRLLQGCDLLVGILAWRYGTIPEGKEKSITEIEHDAAPQGSGGKPQRIVFLLDGLQTERELDPGPGRGVKLDKLDAFKARMQQAHSCNPFNDRDLGRKVVRALDAWRVLREKTCGPSAPSPGPEPHDEYDARSRVYLDRAAELHGSLQLAGFGLKVRAPIQLEELYVPLEAMLDLRAVGEPHFGGAEDAERELRAHEATGEIPLIDAFARAFALGKRRGLVILGDPGSGKTTHLKRVLVQCAHEGPQALGLPAGTVPVFLPLRDLAPEDRDLASLLARELAGPALGFEAGLAPALLADGRLLFLLDGLDEVPTERRPEVKRWLESALTHYPKARFALTCRYAGYSPEARLDEHFLELHLRPLSKEQAERFVHNWFRIVETALDLDRARALAVAEKNADDLVARLAEPDFRARRVFELTRNPLLLTAICLVQRDRGRLPHRRVELYEECVNTLLERWREAKKLPVTLDAKSARRILQPMALWLHQAEGRTRATAAELDPVLQPALASLREKGLTPERFLALLRDESGLLTGWSDRHFGFLHLGFQEYLAARAIRERHFAGESVLATLATHFGESWWNEVTLLLLALEEPPVFGPLFDEIVEQPAFAEHSELVDMSLDDALEINLEAFRRLLARAPGKERALWERQLVALRVLERHEPAAVQALRETLARHPLEAIRRRFEPKVAEVERLLRGPGLEVVRIPAGTFQMGAPENENGSNGWERPVHSVGVSSFLLTRTPITNAQYARFLLAEVGVNEPKHWGDRRYNQPDQPVVGVSWQKARAYCRWAGGDLPTEAQWEYACRAGTSSRFWSGDSDEDLARVGWFAGNSGGKLHAAGEKPANPWGALDMSGNVWEWCRDWFGDYSEANQTDPRGPTSGSNRVIRGGSFWDVADGSRSAYRFWTGPSNRGYNLGFRVAFPAAAEDRR